METVVNSDLDLGLDLDIPVSPVKTSPPVKVVRKIVSTPASDQDKKKLQNKLSSMLFKHKEQLKRDIAKKLEKLEKRTARAIGEIIRERLKADTEEDLASAVQAGASYAAQSTEDE